MQATAPLAQSLVDILFPPGIELDCPVSVLDGKIPPEIRGTLYQNRPGAFQVGRLRYGHWLDGDGLLSALWLSGGAGWFKSRFVQTRKRQEETTAQTPLYRAFGTGFAGDRLGQGFSRKTPLIFTPSSMASGSSPLESRALPWRSIREPWKRKAEKLLAG